MDGSLKKEKTDKKSYVILPRHTIRKLRENANAGN
jgi:hypothetical protein